MHWNCNSLLGKFIDFAIYAEENKPDIILLNEVKSNQEIINSEVTFKKLFTYLQNTKRKSRKRWWCCSLYAFVLLHLV
jgi:exonuclease III